MVRAINRLSAVKVRALKAPGRYADGDGLYLYISAAGNRSWVFRYRDRITGKLRDKGLGPERHLTLEKAREAASEARAMLLSGVDPIDAKKADRQRQLLERTKAVTFATCMDRYITAHEPGWRNAKHAQQWRNTLNTYAAPLLPLPVASIDTGLVVGILQPIWHTRTETASRVRQRVEAVVDWAIAHDFREGPNPARWRGLLDKLLPAANKVKKVEPRAALHYQDLPAFFESLGDREGLAPKALQLQILTATRPSEVVCAQWSEFDLDNSTWTIPAQRMKAGKEHRVPLPLSAVALLRSLPAFRDSPFAFPGLRPGRAMTTAALLKVLKEMRPGLTVHGFRSTFRDWAADMTAYPREVAEEALAHTLSNKTEAAYRRSDLFTKRTRLMADWGAYCTNPPLATSVVPLQGKKRRAG